MAASFNYRFLVVFTAFALLALSGCGSVGGSEKSAAAITPYRMDIVQGNVVTREQVAYLKPGMPRMLVRDVLGTSLLVSVFHAQRWDYVFTLERQGTVPQTRRVTIFFKNDVLERVESDELPTEADFVSTLKSNPKTEPVPAMEATPERLAQFPAAAPAAKSVTPVPAMPVIYPPLEPVGR